tara:strand:- start:168 stop:452 length:285 start_codon:yes stop_codon:yes gene_type:complete
MSKFLDVNTVQGNNQIEVVDSGGVSGNIRFYDKRDRDGNLKLGFKVVSGNISMFSTSNGTETVIIETFKYSEIIEPSSADLSSLVQQLNSFLYT